MSKSTPRQKRRLPAINDVIRGSAVIMERVCGKPTCRCLKGHKHKSLYVSQYHKGGQRMVYIPKSDEKIVLRLVGNYRILKSAIHKYSELNLGRFTANSKKRKKLE